jgi:N-acetylglucosaminyldiphosphoundecaprenol N-acetyl-beta-D-mannosaminyltransferase
MDHAVKLTSPLPLPAIQAARTRSSERIFLGKAPIDALSMQQATGWLQDALVARAPGTVPLQIMGPNAYLVSLAESNPRFAQALAQASLCLPDGMSTVWAGRLLGVHIPERVPGGEFMEQMCARCAAAGLSVYFLGGIRGAAQSAARQLTERYPGLIVSGVDCPPFQFELDTQANARVCNQIAAAQPDLLFVALGAPRQEIWMMEHCPALPIGAVLSVGAAFDTQAGLRKRAPRWTHNIGMEWAYRFAMEPRRLCNLHFFVITAKTWHRRNKKRPGAAWPDMGQNQ